MNNTPFSQQVSFLNKGTLDDELTQELSELIKSVRETGKTGALNLVLKVSMLNAKDENAVKITPVVTIKQPKFDPYETIMWSTADGDLLRHDPLQEQFDLRQVDQSTGEIRKI